ncbi:MAG TPA: 2,3-bisphosphoglycerate-dependent phosphoglycerate mutase [Candidatus Xenobia bacterium]|jgi:2,3-bisphosphoglycerate-dependent phosphoglycerate mutase
MATLVLLRHGESAWNLENRFTGWVDVPLSPKGEEEARQAGAALKGVHFDLAYTSKLKRAQDTLKIVLQVLGITLPTQQDQALNERHYGDLQGLNKAETAQKFGDEQVHIWRRSFDVPPPNGESLKDTAARTLPYYHAHIEPDLKAGKNVLVVAHGNSLRSIVMALDHMTPEQVVALNLATGVPLVYEFDASLQVTSKKLLAL